MPREDKPTTYIASIHAPAQGATHSGPLFAFGVVASIHAPARGATQHEYREIKPYWTLQSTLPHGERPPPIDASSL